MVVNVNLDTRTKKTLPIQADWVGKLPSDLNLVRSKILPPEIELNGPKTILDSMSTLYTKSIPLNSLNSSGQTSAKVVIPSAFLKAESGSKEKVVVEYEIKKRQ